MPQKLLTDQTKLQALGLPRLSLRRTTHADGSVRTVLLAQGKTVGAIAGEHGQVSLKPEFAAQYPVLARLTLTLDPNGTFQCTASTTCAARAAAPATAPTEAPPTAVAADAALQAAARPAPGLGEPNGPALPVGATILLSKLARTYGLSAALTQVTPQLADFIFTAANGILQQNSAKLDRLESTAYKLILGPYQYCLDAQQMQVLMTKVKNARLIPRFYRNLGTRKLQELAAKPHECTLTYWFDHTYSDHHLLFITELDTGLTWYCAQVSDHSYCKPYRYYDLSSYLVHDQTLVAHVLAALQAGQDPLKAAPATEAAAPQLPCQLQAIIPGTELESELDAIASMKKGVDLTYRLQLETLEANLFLNLYSDEELSAAPEVTWGTSSAHHLPYTARPSHAVTLEDGRTKQHQRHLYFFGFGEAFKQKYDAEYQKAKRWIAQTNRGEISDEAQACVDYDRTKGKWVVCPETCHQAARLQQSWILATSLPLDGRATFKSYKQCEHSRAYLEQIQQPLYDVPKSIFQKSSYGAGTLFLQLYALELRQALRARAEGALQGAYGCTPMGAEVQLPRERSAIAPS